MNRKGLAYISLILIAIVALIGAGSYLLTAQKVTSPSSQVFEPSPITPPPAPSPLTESPTSPTSTPTSTSESEIVCPTDVKVCSSGGVGEPRTSIQLRRVPPRCEFPECPG